MKLSIVIPAYNESENIQNTLTELFCVIGKIPEIKTVEAIIVDDHSSDATYKTVNELNDPRVVCMRLSKRSGSHVAIRAGLKEARGDAVLCLSADGQDDPSCLALMLERWRQGAAIVWALRKTRSGESWYIRKAARLFYKLLIMLGGNGSTDIDISRATFFLIDRNVVQAIDTCSERNTSVFGLIVWLGFSQDFVEHEHRSRRFGTSKWNLVKRLHLASDWIIGFSGLPLSLIFVIGIFIVIIGFLHSLYITIDVVMGNPLQGWACVMAAILLLNGVLMIMLGVIGEYLWRNLDESRKRPLFFIEKRFSAKKERLQ